MGAKVARATGATAIGVTAGFAGSSVSVVSSTMNLVAAERVASQFVSGFEGFSYQDPGAKSAVADLATPGLAALLTSPSAAAAGPALAAEKFQATAHVVGFEVGGDSPMSIDLLVRTDIRISTVDGSSSSVRLVPVTLVRTLADWKVSAVDGLTAPAPGQPTSGSPDVPPRDIPAAAPVTTTTGPGDPSGGPPGSDPLSAVGDVPAAYEAWMKAAAAQCPGLPWTVLAGIAKVESDFGRSTLPGVSSGSNPEGAEGPMQFEPGTFAAYGTVAPGGADPASPYDPADAVSSAARLLCADGGANPARLHAAIFDYNHSDAYVSLVLAYANAYAQIASGGTSPGVVERGLGSVIVADAESYLGTPYVWGGENPRTGFDCSGLVQWVYAEAGISLPRVAQDQFDAGPHLAVGAILYPGDLVFFGSGPSGVEHVGVYVGNGEMIDAPYTGAVVRFDRVATVPLGFVGATRPEIPDLTIGSGVPVISTAFIQPTAGGSAPVAQWHQGSHGGAGQGRPSGSGANRDASPSTGPRHPGRHHPTTTTSPPIGTTTTTTAPRHRHHPTTTTTTTSTSPIGTTTTTTPTTTTTKPTTTTTAPTTTTTATAPTTTPSGDTTTTSLGPARHHPKGG